MAAEGSFRLFGKMIQVGKEMEQKVSIAQEAGTKEEEDTGEKSTAAASALPEKPAKRPAKDDGIPCPRCRSRDTKFCYYNNYNANQPRHFCRSCQRYWTAGGAMRNVPVGAGRRRSKGLRAAVPPEASQADAGNAKVLSFTVGNYPTHHAAPAGPTCFWTGPCDQSPPPPILPSSPPPLPPTWTVDFDGGSRPGRWEERRGPVPETLRIDLHAEAAGIGMMGVVLFRSKKESKCQELGVRSFSHVMSSNPAAFSRSLNFQESI